MSRKKCFNLIYEENIHVAPGVKVIPGKEFSKALDAEGTLATVREEAEKYRVEVATECEEIKLKAYQEGFEEGFKKWAGQLSGLEKEIVDVKKKMEKMIIPIALKAAKKIVGREMETSEEIIVDIVGASLKAVSQHKNVKIYVNKKDQGILESHRERLKGLFEKLESFSVQVQDDIEEGGCIIETEVGIINAQISNKWEALENAFQLLMEEGTSPEKATT